MLARRQKPHAARLLFVGAGMALLGLALSVSIVMLKYPRHREICSSWAGPAQFDPNINQRPFAPVGSIVKSHLLNSADIQSLYEEGIIGSLEFSKLRETVNRNNANSEGKKGNDFLHRRLEMSDAAKKYYDWMKEVNEKIPFIPILPMNVTNAYDEAAVELWIAENHCIRPMPDSTSDNDPLSQRVIRRIMTNGVLITYCCQETRLELFFPPTISESIRDWSAPEGRIFFGFMIIASVLVLFSSHPYTLSNVCSAHDSVFGFINTAWLRNYFPPIGLMLVACVPTVPVDVMYTLAPTLNDLIVNLIMFSVHMCGAIGSFFGYAMAEVWALNILPDKWDPLIDEIEDTSDIIFHKQLHHGYQRLFRIVAVLIILGGCFFFSVGFTVVMFAGSQKYIQVNEASLLFFRFVTYSAEAAAAAGLGISLLVIWYYCPERFVPIAIERDFLVLEQFVNYLEGVEGMTGRLADVLKLPEGPERRKVVELEEQTYREFEIIRRKRNKMIEQIDQKYSGLKKNVQPDETEPFLDRFDRKKTINFTDGHLFKRRLFKSIFHRPQEQLQMAEMLEDSRDE